MISTHCHDYGKTTRLGSDEHSSRIPIDYDSLVQLFAERYPRRMLLVGPVVDETESKKDQIQYIFIIVLLFENLHRFTKVFSF